MIQKIILTLLRGFFCNFEKSFQAFRGNIRCLNTETRMSLNVLFVGLIIFVFLILISFKNVNATEKVTLQLRWDHQFQFAGYYAAKWQGYYERAGFDVAIQSAVTPDGQIVSSVEAVAKGDADFGVGAADIIMGRDKGYPLVVLAVIFQQSAAEFYVREGTELNSLADLTRLRVARNVNDLIDVEFQAMLQSEGIDSALVPPYPHEIGLEHLLKGRVDVMPGYRISVPYHAHFRGVKLKSFRPSSYGIDFYGDSLFTRKQLIKENQEAVRRFAKATLEGWKYALDYPDEVADRITHELTRSAPSVNLIGLNKFQIKGIRELTLYPVVQLGHVNPNRWRRMHTFLKRAGVVESEFSEDIIFDPVRRGQERASRIQKILLTGLFSIFMVALLSLCWIILLRKAVAKRTRALISANKELEDEIEERKHAEKLLEETVKDLRETRDKLGRQEKLVMLGQLSGGIAHELRNPLGAIRNAVYFLNMIMDDAKPEMKETVGIIAKEVGISERIINSLLGFARSKPPCFQKTDISSLIQEILAQTSVPKTIEVIIRTDDIPTDFQADADHLSQIFRNLIRNAVQAMPEGGKLIIGSEIQSPDWMIIFFTDTGEGIAEEHLDKIFEPLFTTKSRGTGIGLSLSKSLAEGHGGDIEVRSEVGKGSTFMVKLPLEKKIKGDV
ncbi:ABC transporter substrate-binding protein [Desulfonema magnum]|uniref:histidine kinase n=1 Tax=Desulfonema magnum TaxID=45655 RepID=A0A975GMG5_9BACT|nr:ABC transporter substrate-binding protein [Desulfonema magnum]QTA86640.1 Putative two component system response regulator [Desulfonema magnum]